MNYTLRKILAVFIVLCVIFGWLVTVTGIGPISPLKDRMSLGLDIKGGVYVVMEADAKDIKGMSDDELRQAMEQTQTVIENRINANGLGEPTITIEGQNRIRVEIPEVDDPEEAIELIGKTAKLQFMLADGTIVLEGSNVKKAEAARDDQSTGYAVNLQFDRKGADAFGEATTKAYNGEVTSSVEGVDGGAIAIVLDDQIISAPHVNEPILGGTCTITGDFDLEEAQRLAAQINGGALPITLNEVTSSVQSATIGYNALEMSVIGGLIGLAIILLLMLFIYRGLGLCADIALLLYVVLILNIMSSMGTVLTLPGIAGIIISIGMAVDANVVIFSRIREEITLGRTVRVATETGSKRAMTTVIDSQVTTLIAAVILYEIGTSAVKGFAYTFMVGIIVSIFTAVFITQLYVKLMAGSDKFAKKSFFGIKEDNSATFHFSKTLPIMEKRKIFYCISAGILIIGLAFGVIRGLNYGIDFTGGTMIQLDMGKQVKIEQVDKAIKDFDLNPQIIYAGSDNDQIVIRTVESLDKAGRAEVITAINDAFGIQGNDNIVTQEYFGPSVGKELRNNAILAIIIAAICMMIYIRIRFRQWKFGGAAMLGVLHDVLIVISFYAIFGITVDNPFIAGILTVVGYSINDTIVIFDRIRENIRYMKRGTLKETIDQSISQTLGRSLMTSLTTIIVMVPIVIIAGESIREFVFPLMVGVLAGTYSSICVCSPFFFELGKRGRTTEYQRQIKEAEKKAKKKAKKEGKPYVPKKVEVPKDEELIPEETVKADEPISEIEAEAAETAEAPEAPAEAPSKKADVKKEANKKRSKRYVKGGQKKEEPKQTEDEFRL
ncbi:MAG: protein translocase subunit SecD [Clostridia bacterium]|nr:protein translocase subunit SecD [Clostridia bacterium]